MYLRPQHKTLIRRLSEPPGRLIVVAGPRQVGKTTLVRDTLKRERQPTEWTYVALDEPGSLSIVSGLDVDISMPPTSHQPDSTWLMRVWEKARIAATAPGQRHPHVLVLDEIHSIDSWSAVVKGLWDADRREGLPLHVVLLGSSPLQVHQGIQDALTGRFELLQMSHWSFGEMSDAFDLDLPRYLYFGGYPGTTDYFNDPDPLAWLEYVRNALVEPTIVKDVLMMHRVDKPALLRQLFELSCYYSGQIVTLKKMKGQLTNAGNETTLAKYLELLGNAGFIRGLQKYAKQEFRKRAAPPKLQVLNTALMSAVSGYSFEKARSDTSYWGRLVESAVGAHLVNAGGSLTRVFYWRENGNEVDFVIERGGQCIAIEVKSSERRFAERGLDVFCDKFPGSDKLVIGSQGIPLEVFLQSGPDDWFSGFQS